ncbi:16S rRNA (cytidine(1402)-2'-O)-methyltransferase [Leeia sp. TBRC 13508]|uniref:Ribosomal RNA small subunit methyltransferase I n=1 Tax=Leeia speluncae TaxID=2884804 RepID=A0ABS8D363_9NEIS|nr:16S rRNA (cytidine(1402)-2'-O)-methyltransferase [Leeia speluncae]MCB6182619.1 16S rRNA (cytidine(1402)-2'-O)-methyltransferase [Leeia speluncae]
MNTHGGTDKKALGTLYVVATPIGNLQDMTVRATSVLGQVDIVAAEDTRVSGGLLRHLGVRPRLIASHEHNERSSAEKIVTMLQEGQDVAVISDAGTPGVSDPGAVVVAAVLAAGLKVVPIPGPSAAIAAVSASGFTETTFRFVGFLPPKRGARVEAILQLAEDESLQIIYEAPHRILDCLTDLRDTLGVDREIVICRELTKTFETIRRLPLGEAVEWVSGDSNQQRGEFVLVLSACQKPVTTEEGLPADADRLLQILIAELPLKQAVGLAVKITGLAKNELYQHALNLKAALEDEE